MRIPFNSGLFHTSLLFIVNHSWPWGIFRKENLPVDPETSLGDVIIHIHFCQPALDKQVILAQFTNTPWLLGLCTPCLALDRCIESESIVYQANFPGLGLLK